MSAYLKTEMASGSARLWLQIKGPEGDVLALDDMHETPVTGDALQNPSREALLAVLFQGKRLEEMIQEFAGIHWERVKSGACRVEASNMWCEILDRAKWANEYLMEMASNLLKLGKVAGSRAHSPAASGTVRPSV